MHRTLSLVKYNYALYFFPYGELKILVGALSYNRTKSKVYSWPANFLCRRKTV
jgi:hypothetical protein